MKLSQPSAQQGDRGFTLVETVIGLVILLIAASSIFFALTQINRVASVARLNTAAQFIVQSNIDTIQSDAPFAPTNSQVPSELVTSGSRVTTSTVPIYVDPATGNTVVSGTLTTTVSVIYNSSALNEYADLATVQLNYTYRSKNYQALACTVRGNDQ